MKFCKILGLNVKLKNQECKILPIMTAKWEEKVLDKCDNVTNVKYDRHGRSPSSFSNTILIQMRMSMTNQQCQLIVFIFSYFLHSR